MSSARKYLFDNDFARPDAGRAKRAAFTQEQIDAARAEGFEEGRRAGEDAMRAAEERRIADALETMAGQVGLLVQSRAEDQSELARESAQVALAICRKILPTLAARNALTEIEGLIVRCLADLRDEPRVVVRVADSRVEALQARFERMTATFDGKLVLLGDDELAESDCAVLWADGGSERNLSRLWADIHAVVGRVTDADTAPVSRSPLDDLMSFETEAAADTPAGTMPADFPITQTAS